MAQQVKVFVPGVPWEQQVNEWLKENPEVEVLNIWVQNRFDVYQSAPPTVCNQWEEAVVLYKTAPSGRKRCPYHGEVSAVVAAQLKYCPRCGNSLIET